MADFSQRGMFPSRGLRFRVHCWEWYRAHMRERRKLFVCLKMKRHRSQKIGVPFFHDSWVVQVFAYLCALARQCWLRCHGRSDITISHAALGRSQLCGHCGVSVRALSRCAHSMQENLPFFPLFPVWLREKAAFFPSIFGHMEHCQWAVAFWCRPNIPILCGICTFWNAFSPSSAWLWV